MDRGKTTLTALILALSFHANAQSWWAQNSGTTTNLMDINFFDNNTGFTFGDTLSTTVKTTNQGAVWSGLNPSFKNGDIRSSAFLDANTIVAIGIHDVAGGNGIVMKSVNSGNTWTADSTLPEKLFDVAFADALNGWISGENGYIARTTNGGANWLQLTTGTGEDIFSVYFVDANEGWAVGTVTTDAVILHTTNAGTNWTEQTSGITEPLFSVFFTDTVNGWAVGDNGTIIATTDGGTNWVSQTSNTLNALFDVYFLDANKGWAVGGAGTVLKTTDGGANWLLETSGTTADIQSIHMRHDSLGWFCGDGGVIRVYAMNPPSGINDFAYNNIRLEVFPNPSDNWVRIGFDNKGKAWDIKLFDLTGKLLLKKNAIRENHFTIKHGDLLPGFYMVEVSNENGAIASTKIVVE